VVPGLLLVPDGFWAKRAHITDLRAHVAELRRAGIDPSALDAVAGFVRRYGADPLFAFSRRQDAGELAEQNEGLTRDIEHGLERPSRVPLLAAFLAGWAFDLIPVAVFNTLLGHLEAGLALERSGLTLVWALVVMLGSALSQRSNEVQTELAHDRDVCDSGNFRYNSFDFAGIFFECQ